MVTNESFKILAREFRFVSVQWRHVDQDHSVLDFNSVAVGIAATVAIDAFVQSVNGN